MPLHIPTIGESLTAALVWAATARTLTDPDSYKADYDTEMARITAARALLIDALGTPADFMADVSGIPTTPVLTAHFDITEFEKCQAPAAENAAVAVAVVTADQSLGSKDITVDIPANATITSVIAVARINIMNNAATAQKIDLKFEVEGTVLFNQTDIVGLGAARARAGLLLTTVKKLIAKVSLPSADSGFNRSEG